MNTVARLQPALLSILRIVTAYLYIWHGTARFLGFPVFADDSIIPLSLYGMAAVLDILGGTLLLTGLFSRPVAFLLCAQMAAAILLNHAGYQALPPLTSDGEAILPFCLAFLCLLTQGAAFPHRATHNETADAH